MGRSVLEGGVIEIDKKVDELRAHINHKIRDVVEEWREDYADDAQVGAALGWR